MKECYISQFCVLCNENSTHLLFSSETVTAWYIVVVVLMYSNFILQCFVCCLNFMVSIRNLIFKEV